MGLEKAIIMASTKHDGQKDLSGEPYILHPIRVMLKMDTEEEMIIAVLHDVLEDTDTTYDDLALEFGHEIASTLTLLTHKKDEAYMDYIIKLSSNEIARKIKIADLRDNLNPARNGKLPDSEKKSLRNTKYLASLNYLLNQKVGKS